MKFYGKAKETADLILSAFEKPNQLPVAIAPIFIEVNTENPCRKWSWSNQLLCALAGTTDARGIRQWNEAGRRVKTGARAFHILVPISIKKETMKLVIGAPDDTIVKTETIVIGYKSAPVFRVEDTDGAPLDYETQNQPFIDSLPCIEVARAWGINIKTYNGARASALGYCSAAGIIGLGVQNLSTWAHELIHAADARAFGPLKGGQHVDQEIVAELGGAVLLKVLGYDTDADLGGCYSYCKTYADKHEKALVSVCTELLNRTCNAVALVLEHARDIVETAEYA